MATFNKFNSFVEALGQKKHNLNADMLKVVLSNTAPSASNSVLADIVQIANGNGYTTGGATAGSNTFVQSGGTAKLVANDVTFTATGSLGPYRYSILYNDTATNDELIGWWDKGASETLSSGETHTVNFDSGTGILQLV